MVWYNEFIRLGFSFYFRCITALTLESDPLNANSVAEHLLLKVCYLNTTILLSYKLYNTPIIIYTCKTERIYGMCIIIIYSVEAYACFVTYGVVLSYDIIHSRHSFLPG